jgi:hypothetical protein
MRSLLAQPDLPSIEPGVPQRPRIESAAQIGALLQAAGAAVLRASLPAGALRHAAAALLGSAVPLTMAGALAQSLVARTQGLAAAASSISGSAA